MVDAVWKKYGPLCLEQQLEEGFWNELCFVWGCCCCCCCCCCVMFLFECLICRKHTQPITVWKHPEHIPNQNIMSKTSLLPDGGFKVDQWYELNDRQMLPMYLGIFANRQDSTNWRLACHSIFCCGSVFLGELSWTFMMFSVFYVKISTGRWQACIWYPSTNPTTPKKWIGLIYSLKVSFHLTTSPRPKKKAACIPWRFWGALAKRRSRRSAGGWDGPHANARAACGAGRKAEGRGHGIHNVKWWSTAGWICTLQLSWKKRWIHGFGP